MVNNIFQISDECRFIINYDNVPYIIFIQIKSEKNGWISIINIEGRIDESTLYKFLTKVIELNRRDY